MTSQNIPMLIPRFPNILPLNGGLRNVASTVFPNVKNISNVTKITIFKVRFINISKMKIENLLSTKIHFIIKHLTK